MKLIREIKDDVFGLDLADSAPINKEREAIRAILLNDKNQIGLIYARNGNYYKLPGGGIQENEDHKVALMRELIEETGYECEIIGEVGKIVAYQCQSPTYVGMGMKHISYCYVAKTKRFVGNNLMDDEQGDGFELVWVDGAKEAIDMIKNAKVRATEWTDKYTIGHMSERDRTLLEAYLDKKGQVGL